MGLKWQLRAAAISAVGVCLFLVGFGVWSAWHALFGLPRTYDHLRRSGERATGYLDVCAPGIGGGRGVGCRVRLTFDGRSRTWAYPEDSAQFERLPQGASIAMLVDPAHPATAYTVRDVAARTNAGWSPLTAFGVGLAALGLFGLVAVGRIALRLRRRVL